MQSGASGVLVAVGVGVDVGVRVAVAVFVGVAVGVRVAVLVAIGVFVGVEVGVKDAQDFDEDVAVTEDEFNVHFTEPFVGKRTWT